jgi:hypothetical protein
MSVPSIDGDECKEDAAVPMTEALDDEKDDEDDDDDDIASVDDEDDEAASISDDVRLSSITPTI